MLAQTFAITRLNLASLPRRWGASLVVVLSLAGVIGVLVAVLAMAGGLQKTFARSGKPDRVIVVRSGQQQAWQSRMSRDEAQRLLALPGLAHGADGAAIASLETFSVARLTKRATGGEASVGIRGVSADVLEVRPEVKLVAGRMPQTGKYELAAGVAVRRVFQGLEVGAQLRLADSMWTVVGVFEAGGGVLESELWADTDSVMSALNRTAAYNAFTGLLESEAALETFKTALQAQPNLPLTAWREPEFYAAQDNLASLIRTFGYLVAVIMALGALFSAANALYASVRSRTVEIATLRAIGFGATPVVISVLLEGLLLCAAGAALGGGLAYPLFNGYTVSSNAQGFSQVAFAFSVDAALLLQGLLWACAVGLLGGLPPAIRAARLPVAEALRPA